MKKKLFCPPRKFQPFQNWEYANIQLSRLIDTMKKLIIEPEILRIFTKDRVIILFPSLWDSFQWGYGWGLI